MKKYLRKQGITLVALFLISVAIAQTPAITMQNNLGDYYGTLDFSLANPPVAVGIGNFPTTVSPASALHINTNTSMGSVYYGAGEVFRTDAPAGATYWRMFRDVSGTSTQFGSIYNNNDNHFYIMANNASGDLRFNTGGSTTSKMTVTSGGNVGVGLTAPTYKLDVDGGDIHIDDPDRGYMINDNYVLLYNNNASNIYVGVGAGISSSGSWNTFVGTNAGRVSTASYNTFIGNDAGLNNTTGASNTFIGYTAGTTNVAGNNNTFIGVRAGKSNTANFNTITGFEAGEDNSTGQQNTIYGKRAGRRTTTGNYNSFFGAHSGYLNGDGNSNAFFGSNAGYNNTGDRNVFIGAVSGTINTVGTDNTLLGCSTQVGSNSLVNATAIGANTIVMNNDHMILGDNSVNVGIGLSGSPVGPRSKLEINSNAWGASGLQFTYLTSLSPTFPGGNPGPGVLAVDIDGKVIYVPDNTITGNVSACATPNPDYITKWCGTGGNEIEETIIYEDNDQRIGIGIQNTFAKLHVNNNTELIGELVQSTLGGWFNIGTATVAGNASVANLGSIGQASPNGFLPVNGVAVFTIPAYPFNVGIVGQAEGALFNFGGIFEANSCSNGALVNIGVYASARNCLNNSVPGPAAYFQGNTWTTGQYLPLSDENVKDSITNVTDALSVITSLHPKHYVFKTGAYPYMQLPTGSHFGFIAQDMDTILPDLVQTGMQPAILDTSGTILQDTMTLKTLNYDGLIALSIAGIQEQQAIIDSLKDEQVTADPEAVGDTNRLVKWSFTDRELTNSLVYDDGNRVGIPAVKQGSYLNVENTGTDTVAVNATSTNPNTTAVVNAVYTVDSGESNVVAVRGYSKYQFEPGDEDGTGGSFEGGRYGVHGVASGIRNKGIGVFGESSNSDSKNTGVAGYATSTTTADNIGVRGLADGSEFGNGAFVGTAEYVNSTSVNAAYIGYAAGSSFQNFGGDFEAYDTAGTNYGVYAYANGSAPNAYAGYFTGDVHATGTVTWTSDANLKAQVKDINTNTALQLIERLQPKTYTFRTADYPYLSLPQGQQYGLLAQDVEQVLPMLVSDIVQPERRNAEGQQLSPRMEYKGLNYAGLIPILVGAVKEQQAKAKEQQTKIDSLTEVITNRLDALEARLNGCCGTGSANKTGNEKTTANQLTVELSSTQVVILEQNVPNPFAEQTSISYFIPENITNAQLVFTDILGNNIKQVEVKSGYGTVTVFASNLTSGQYSYSLVIDGKVVETKRMVKTK